MLIKVIAHPNSKIKRIEKDLLKTLHVYVNKPPNEGKANTAIIEMLSKHFKINKNAIILVSGEKSKNKTFEILIPQT